MHNLLKAISIQRMTNKTRTKFIFLHCFFFFSAANATELDWFPRESLTDEQQASVNKYCQGRYIDQWQASQGDDTRIFADVIIRTGGNRLRLQGGAEIRQANQSFQADNIEGELNRNYQLSGNVISRQKGQLIKASDATINKYEDKNDALFNNAEFLFHNSKVRGEAGSIHKTQHGLIFIEEGFYTTCEPGSGSWQMYGSSIELNPETGFGTAKHVQIRVDGFPVFYFPWMRFPIDERRQTGFLFPEFGYSGSDGASISAPYYLNLAPQLDATITSHFVEHEGEGFDLELRHLSPYGLTTYEESSFFQKNENRQIVPHLSVLFYF